MQNIEPQLIADVTLYTTANGGRSTATPAEWFGCPCKVKKDDFQARDCRILLHGKSMAPGETRRVGIVFLSGDEVAVVMRQAGKFYLWEGRIIGEAVVIET